MANRKKLYSCNEHFFDNLSSERAAYWLGFIMADGCVWKPKNRYSGVLAIDLAMQDRKHVEQFKKDIGYDGPIYYRRSVGIRIRSKHVFQRLESYGVVPRKTMILEFPSKIPTETMHHFLRGYMDGDGSLGTYYSDYLRTFAKASGTKAFLSGLQQELVNHLDSIGLGSWWQDKGTWQIMWTDRQDCKDISAFLYSDCTVALWRKYDKAMEILALPDVVGISARPDIDGEQVILDYRCGLTLRQVAAKHDCSVTAVCNRLRWANEPIRPMGRPKKL